jgi:Fe2+ or Zn2+ uptake regulation protein
LENEIRTDRGLTKYRRVVLDVLKKNPHSDAYEVHRLAAEIEPSISLPTVYRALKYLKSKGYIVEHRFRENHSHYEVVSEEGKGVNAHLHFICERCGSVEDIEVSNFSLAEEVVARKGFKIGNIHLDVFGLCENCSKNV